MTVLGVGIDVADVRHFERLVERHGSGLLGRWFTQRELVECRDTTASFESVSSRFAVKEAVWKALGLPSSSPLSWQLIEVLAVERAGGITVDLGGWISDSAARAGVHTVSAGIARSGHLVVAFVIVEGSLSC